MKTIKDISIGGKRVLIRVDFNVPRDTEDNITDDSRIRRALPTLSYALGQNARVIVASHLGRPKGQVKKAFSLSPVAAQLGRLLEQEVPMAEDCIGSNVRAMVDSLAGGRLLLLENLRFHAGEQKNDHEFAQQLAELCDIYVNNAFAVSHRAHASVEAITQYVPVCVAGFLLQKELDYFKKAMADPQRPLVAIVGGSKVSTKLAAIQNMMNHVDKFVVGGAMANTFLRSQGFKMGASKIENEMIDTAGSIVKEAIEKEVKFYLPVDLVVAAEPDSKSIVSTVPFQEVPNNRMALDIGPATSMLYSQVLRDAKTIVWNGPMGVFEIEAFSRGTTDLVEQVARSEALTIVGGGDTDVAVHKAGATERISYISTGGGAFLALLEGKTLPAVAALETNKEKD